VLIKVRSVSLNRRDVDIATSQYPLPIKEQVVLCSDMVGEVVDAGSEVLGLSVGGRVIAPLNLSLLYGQLQNPLTSFGGMKDVMLREYIALPANVVVRLPSHLTISRSGQPLCSLVLRLGMPCTVIYR
jgi:NADPH:quinone reductase-like Zn-dependent oxidoreductase